MKKGLSRIRAMKGFCMLLCGLLTMSACSDADSRDETLAVYGATVFTVSPSSSVVTDEVLSVEQLKEMLKPVVTSEECSQTLTTEGEETREDITFMLREASGSLDIVADVTDKTRVYKVRNEVLTFSPGEYVSMGLKLVVRADGIMYSSMAVGGEVTERCVLELQDYRYVHEVSREEVSVQADTYSRVFHSEVNYGQPLVALRFSDGGQVYKCSIEDQDRARLER